MTSVNPSSISAVQPLWAVEGGSVNIHGAGFSFDPLPEVKLGGAAARIAFASPRLLSVTIPPGLDGGRVPVRVSGAPGATVYLDVGVPLATGLHQVDNPAFDAAGNLYVTFSGTRGQQAPVAIYIVRPGGVREPFVENLPNPTSLAFDQQGRLHVSSRFDGSVHRVAKDGSVTTVATDLGVACGIAFGPDGDLFVGDRSGSILRVHDGKSAVVASLPPSVAAFHLAFGPDHHLYVSGPTLSARDSIYRISPEGDVEVFSTAFGRPQGLAFDTDGNLYVADALAGNSGVYRLRPGVPGEPELMLSGGTVLGLAFDPGGGIVLASADTVYRLDVPLRGLLPVTVT